MQKSHPEEQSMSLTASSAGTMMAGRHAYFATTNRLGMSEASALYHTPATSSSRINETDNTTTTTNVPSISKRKQSTTPTIIRLDSDGMSKDELSRQLDAVADLLEQQPRTDGGPRRPMNAFLIFARWRRLQMAERRSADHSRPLRASVAAESSQGLRGRDKIKCHGDAIDILLDRAPKPADVSAALGYEWKNLTPDQQAPFHRKATQLRKDFDAKNPKYKFTRGPKGAAKRRQQERLEAKLAAKRQMQQEKLGIASGPMSPLAHPGQALAPGTNSNPASSVFLDVGLRPPYGHHHSSSGSFDATHGGFGHNPLPPHSATSTTLPFIPVASARPSYSAEKLYPLASTSSALMSHRPTHLSTPMHRAGALSAGWSLSQRPVASSMGFGGGNGHLYAPNLGPPQQGNIQSSTSSGSPRAFGSIPLVGSFGGASSPGSSLHDFTAPTYRSASSATSPASSGLIHQSTSIGQSSRVGSDSNDGMFSSVTPYTWGSYSSGQQSLTTTEMNSASTTGLFSSGLSSSSTGTGTASVSNLGGVGSVFSTTSGSTGPHFSSSMPPFWPKQTASPAMEYASLTQTSTSHQTGSLSQLAAGSAAGTMQGPSTGLLSTIGSDLTSGQSDYSHSASRGLTLSSSSPLKQSLIGGSSSQIHESGSLTSTPIVPPSHAHPCLDAITVAAGYKQDMTMPEAESESSRADSSVSSNAPVGSPTVPQEST